MFVPGNHSGFADLVPGNPATVDEPDLDTSTAASTTGGKLAAGTYEYAVTDQFNPPRSPRLGPDGESAAYVTPRSRVPANGRCRCSGRPSATPPTTTSTVRTSRPTAAGSSSVTDNPVLGHAARQHLGYPTVPPPTSPGGGETELTFTDTGSRRRMPGRPVTAPPPPPGPPQSSRTPRRSPWEANPYFAPALAAVGITAVGDDASKPYPNPPTTSSVTGRPTGPSTPPARPSWRADLLRLARGTGCPSPPDQHLLQRLDRGPGAGRVQHPVTSTVDGGQCTPSSTRRVTAPADVPTSWTASSPRCSTSCSPTTPSRATSTRRT